MRLFVTGDTHGRRDIKKFRPEYFPQGQELTKQDVVAVLGDTWIYGSNDPTVNEQLIDTYNGYPWTTAFIKGNHENHPKLNSLPTTVMWDNVVHVVSDSLYMLQTGRTYKFDEAAVLTIGGALSQDRNMGFVGIDWFEEELPSREEIERVFDSLHHMDGEFDYIWSHTVPRRFLGALGLRELIIDPTTKLLDEVFDDGRFQKWFCGHLHRDYNFSPLHLMYNSIQELQTKKG